MHMFVMWMRLFLMANNPNKTISKKPQSSSYSHLSLQDGLKTSRPPHGDWFTDSLRPVWILLIISTGARSNLSFSDSVLQLSWLSCFSHWGLWLRIRASVMHLTKQISDCWVLKGLWCWCLVHEHQDTGQVGCSHGRRWDTCGRGGKATLLPPRISSPQLHPPGTALQPCSASSLPRPLPAAREATSHLPLVGHTPLFHLWKVLSRSGLESTELKSRQDSRVYVTVLLIAFI